MVLIIGGKNLKDYRYDLFPLIATEDGGLKNLSYKLNEFKEKRKGDHAHCELCWIIICECEQPTKESYGYYCKETGCWLCKKCFKDFAKEFNWNESL